MVQKKNSIVIVDYGMGNLKNVQNAFKAIGHDSEISSDYKEIKNATHLVLPGVGGFKDAMKTLSGLNLVNPLKDHISMGKPFLGVCLGMQLLFESSEEFGHHEGLGILKGKVVRFDEGIVPLIPHIGWNNVRISRKIKAGENATEHNGVQRDSGRLAPFKGIKNGSFFYFLHSFYCVPSEDITVATCEYYHEFTACIKKGSIFACQFHPEKSHNAGLKMLYNFAFGTGEQI